RIITTDITEQERVTTQLRTTFPGAPIIDRRANPSFGCRALHVIAQSSGKLVEIQIRSSLQHLWAEYSEKLSDVHDSRIKYGGGPEVVRTTLRTLSRSIAQIEAQEMTLADLVFRCDP